MPSTDDVKTWSPQGPSIELSDEHCWDLLTVSNVGRLAVIDAHGPDIFPVNFALDGNTVIFRSGEGSKLSDLTRLPKIALETDGATPEGRWSVVVRGRATTITDVKAAARLDFLPFPQWRPVAPFVYVRLAPDRVRGRRFLKHLTLDRLPASDRD